MELVVLKGFLKEDISKFDLSPLLDISLEERFDVLKYNDSYKANLFRAITNMNMDSYMLYEEFAFLSMEDNGESLKSILSPFGIQLKVLYNNIYPEIYPCNFEDTELLDEFIMISESSTVPSEKVGQLSKIFNQIYFIGNCYYVSYNNIEYDMIGISLEKKFDSSPKVLHRELEPEFIYEINENGQEYIEKINEIVGNHYTKIGIKLMGDSLRVKDLYSSFCAFLNTDEKYFVTNYESFSSQPDLVADFYDVVTRVLKVPDFSSFRDLEFYDNPSLTNKLIKINQTQIMTDMVEQVLNAQKSEKLAIETAGAKLLSYRDIFVTAPTGAGKSLMFQVPAIYLAEKYGLLTIIITPLIELMNDQVRNLKERGYLAAERLNSSVNPVEKKNIVKRINDKEIHLLYLSPETLLSYSIDQLIGDRKIGMVIIDEAHIVSTWGKGFRPDYWYLGSYLESLRKVRNSRGLKDADKSIYCFPICTFTATAVNGGRYDDVSDIKNSLMLRDTITYFGKVVRDNIRFCIVNHSDDKTANLDDYRQKKNEVFKERLSEYINRQEKTIVYFPYASTALAAYNAKAEVGFDCLSSLTDYFSIYIGGDNLSNEEKSSNMLDFRSGEKNIMFATKAFGMGIDIKDIKNVYHYAASGNLNDYVQEIGRVARSKDIPYGIAASDYFDRDLNFMKSLYGMSALHDYQVQKILSIIINIYDSKKKSNLLFTPDMFRPVFPQCDDNQLENKIKSALLTIEKDFISRYKGSKTIVTRSRNMFTECFAMVDESCVQSLMSSKYGKYFTKIAFGRNKEADFKKVKNPVYVTDMGDIFSIDLKQLWEELHSQKTFGEFKYQLNNNAFEIFGAFAPHIKLRSKVVIKMMDNTPLSTLKAKLFEEINIVSNVLNEMQIEGSFFSKDDIALKLDQHYKNKFKANTVANSYLEMINEYKDIYVPTFYETKIINEEVKYRIINGNFRSIAEKIVNASSLIKRASFQDETEYVTYRPTHNSRIQRDNSYDAVNMALLFGLVSFEIIGGSKPEIFIRINYPDKVRQIVEGRVFYKNSLIDQAKKRHDNDVSILSYFFTQLSTDEERWKFIESYYLGRVFSNDGTVIIDQNNEM